ncbi:MAG: S9 family peptidase [Firmicutes bacterium]|nr:S9 family peptidase [Bacillota bacterium]MCM1401835.1 S9 family peptidase [Bacteroides sp.]MCM1477720.1 S9 family peptidase [Bacteroides sp.]
MKLIKIFLALSLLFPFTGSAKSGASSVKNFPELERYVDGTQQPAKMAPLQYAPDGSGYLGISADGKRVLKFDIKTGKELETIMDLTHTRETTLNHIEGFQLSPEGSKLLVYLDSENIYRRSFSARYYIYELRSRLLKPLSTEHPRQQSAIFSPDGRMIAFVADGNIYIKKLDYWSEVAVTTDGVKNKIINGVPDWTYEEEFATTCSMTWSPDNLVLCYLKYNESDVPMFSFPLYEGSCNPMKQYALYPGEFSYKYPVAGQQNSKVTLHSYDVETRKIKDITLPGTQIEYIPRIQFGPTAGQLMVTTLNRAQNRMELFSVHPKSTVCKSVLVEQWKAWLDPATYEDIHFMAGSFVITSCRSGYKHLYEYSYSGALQRQITSGNYDVEAYYGCNSVGTHFYCSTSSGAINRVVSSVDRKGKVTDLSPKEGYGTATFSPDMEYYTLCYSNVTTAPRYTLFTSLNNKEIRTLLDNVNYQKRWESAPKAEFFTMSNDGLTLNGYIIKPADFNPSKRYPVIMYEYQGPGSQQVLNRWHIDYENYFAKAGFVVMCVDGRGTGGRGRSFQDVVYKQLGHYESIDQIAAAKHAASLPYVDADRIAIFGWSYGGYEAIMAASQPNAPYAAAVAVAPVTDWRYYDTVYAERYMLTPQENEDGYDQSSTLTHVNNRACPLLIMHGTADDNVHFFNSVQYASVAEAEGKWLDMLLFPNMNHSINSCKARSVVMARLLDYLQRNM